MLTSQKGIAGVASGIPSLYLYHKEILPWSRGSEEDLLIGSTEHNTKIGEEENEESEKRKRRIGGGRRGKRGVLNWRGVLNHLLLTIF